MTSLGMIHSVPFTPAIMSRVCLSKLKNTTLLHVVDERLSENPSNSFTDEAEKKKYLYEAVCFLKASKVDAILVVCSSCVAFLGALGSNIRIPLIRINQSMLQEAIKTDCKIGILASVDKSAQCTKADLLKLASEAGTEPEVTLIIEPKALEAILSGDIAWLNQLLVDAVRRHCSEINLFVMAQISLHPALNSMNKILNINVLSAVEYAVAECGEVLGEI